MTPEAIFGVQKFNAKKNDQTLGLINFGVQQRHFGVLTLGGLSQALELSKPVGFGISEPS